MINELIPTNDFQTAVPSSDGVLSVRVLNTGSPSNNSLLTEYSINEPILLGTEVTYENLPSDSELITPETTVEELPVVLYTSGTCFQNLDSAELITTKEELFIYLCEVLIRFDANPIHYQKGDYEVLIKTITNSLIFLYDQIFGHGDSISEILVMIDQILVNLDTKVDKVAGKELSTNDLTNTLKTYYDLAYLHSQSPHSYLSLAGGTMLNTGLVVNLNADLLDGQHASAFSLTGHTHAGMITTESDPIFTASVAYGIVSQDIINWNLAFGWGNHSIVGYVTGTPWTSMGYLTSQISHADVVVDGDFTSQGIMLRDATSGTYSILTDSSSHWNTAYDWGNHAGLYSLLAHTHAQYLESETDPVFAAWLLTNPIPTPVTPVSNILEWSTDRYRIYTTKKAADPGYAYFYNEATNPSFANDLKLDGSFIATSIYARSASSDGYSRVATNGFTNYFNFGGSSSFISMYAFATESAITSVDLINARAHPIKIGYQTAYNDYHGEQIIIDDYNRLFDINMTTVRLSKGTASSYYGTDADLNLVPMPTPQPAGNYVVYGAADAITGGSFIKTGGLSTEVLMANGSTTTVLNAADFTSSQFPVDINRCGFLNQTETTLSFDPVTYIFTLGSVGASWSYYRNGTKHTITGSKTLTISGTPPTRGLYFIYMDNGTGTLEISLSAWSLTDGKIPVATVVFDNTLTPKYLLADERHSILIDRLSHLIGHTTEGTKLVSGATLSGYTLASAVETSKTFAIDTTVISDEDIFLTLGALVDPDGNTNAYYNIYKAAGNWVWEVSHMPFRYTTTGYIQYDNAGTMTPGANLRWYNTYLVFSDISGECRFLIVSGKQSFTSAAKAYLENFATFDFAGFPIAECIALYQLTWAATTGNTTKGKCTLTRVQRINSNIVNTAQVVTTSHNTLSNLQGGDLDEYYHLTALEYTGVGTGAFLRASTFRAQVTGITVLTAGWTLVSGLYEYSITDAGILSTSIVDVIPANADISIVKTAELLPTTNSSAGSVKIYATNLPSSNFGVTINIF